MRLFKWILMLTVFAMLFAMLPATVAEDEVVIGMEESVDNKIGSTPVLMEMPIRTEKGHPV